MSLSANRHDYELVGDGNGAPVPTSPFWTYARASPIKSAVLGIALAAMIAIAFVNIHSSRPLGPPHAFHPETAGPSSAVLQLSLGGSPSEVLQHITNGPVGSNHEKHADAQVKLQHRAATALLKESSANAKKSAGSKKSSSSSKKSSSSSKKSSALARKSSSPTKARKGSSHNGTPHARRAAIAGKSIDEAELPPLDNGVPTPPVVPTDSDPADLAASASPAAAAAATASASPASTDAPTGGSSPSSSSSRTTDPSSLPPTPSNTQRYTQGGVPHFGHLHPPSEDLKSAIRFFHFSDTHIDPFFNPLQSVFVGQCHSCQLSSTIHGSDAYCPLSVPSASPPNQVKLGYSFGRYKCNPPLRLMTSLLTHLRSHATPDFIVITGDIAPHGMPDDSYALEPDTKLTDLCPTKFLVMRRHIRELKQYFPNTTFVFTMGNNDHFPKNLFWQPYIDKLGEMFVEEGFLSKSQARDFRIHGSNYIDIQNTSLRLICPDMTLLTPGGEASFVPEADFENLEGEAREDVQFPVRAAMVAWLHKTLMDARKKKLSVIIVGHQPIATKNGKDELDVDSIHFRRVRELLYEYSPIIRAALFGHRNLAGLQNILGPLNDPIIPSITVPGVSPRGTNHPSFNEVYLDDKTYHVLEFEQWVFDMLAENNRALRISEEQAAIEAASQYIATFNAYDAMNGFKGSSNNNTNTNSDTTEHKHNEPMSRLKARVVEAGKSSTSSSGPTSAPALLPSGLPNVPPEKYMGRWGQHTDDLYSWRALSGSKNFTVETLSQFLLAAPAVGRDFFSMQIWKRGGYVGDETPENFRCKAMYDEQYEMMRCLFPEQDAQCFDIAWIK